MVEAGMELAVSVAAIAVAGTVVEKVVERVVERAVERAVERVERVEKKIGDRCSGYGGGGYGEGGAWRRWRRRWRWRWATTAAAIGGRRVDDGGGEGGRALAAECMPSHTPVVYSHIQVTPTSRRRSHCCRCERDCERERRTHGVWV
jgi:hypothetical protein